MSLNPFPKTILLDLDNTLFDHHHSVRSALATVQSEYPSLQTQELAVLIDTYNAALEHTYERYLDNKIAYHNTDIEKVQLFFTSLKLPEPSPSEVDNFRAIYKPAYRENRRATPGSVEMLVRLRENGYRLAIVTNGQKEDQTAKAQAIGIAHLVDRIVTSEEAGFAKPDPRIFQRALSAMGASPSTTHMVGDSIESDVKGALNAGLRVVLYSPTASDSTRLLFETQIPVIRHMNQLLDQLRIESPKFVPTYNLEADQLVIKGLGIDLVTANRHCLRMPKQTVRFIAGSMQNVLEDVSNKNYVHAMSRLAEMIKAIAKVAAPIDENAIKIHFPGLEQVDPVTISDCQFNERKDSVQAVYTRLVLNGDEESNALSQKIATLLQCHCDNLMRDYPRAAIRNLRSAILLIADVAGIEAEIVIEGAPID